MATIIQVSDLPASMQTADSVAMMVTGANAKASRVAPCLTDPTSTAWAATTAYAVDDKVRIGDGEFLQVTTAGTSSDTAPTVPTNVGDTVTDGTVTWTRIAPTPDQLAEAKLVLLGAIRRWIDAGAGALQSQTAGPFGMTVDTRQRTGFNLWPSEISSLQEVCSSGGEAKAFSIDTAPTSSVHMPWCNVAFGANYCSCGADLTDYQYPLYEGGVLTDGDVY